MRSRGDVRSDDGPQHGPYASRRRDPACRPNRGLARSQTYADLREGQRRCVLPAWPVSHRCRQWHPEIGPLRGVSTEARGHDADDVDLETTELDATTQDVFIATKRALPQGVAQYGNRVACRRTLVPGGQRTPSLRPYAEHVEIAARDRRRGHHEALVFDDHAGSGSGPGRRSDFRQRASDRGEPLEGCRGHQPCLARGPGNLEPNRADAIWSDDERGWAEKRAIDEPDHGEVDPDRERGRQDGRNGDGWPGPQASGG